ncbi:glutamine--fructose-6-phosphate transaminase (isomerizing) [Candidatus Woesearchaeota archaeon]|nr:glutamine--fructose-6-phosphate transaminase (isomerizing) [Candidatus Woesearchaeota archaeon]
MCGIIGYIGKRQAYPILLEGLQRLEYRGYDSAGIATVDDAHGTTTITTHKDKGRVDVLKQYSSVGTMGIGHTRWATHGVPSTVNAHPHLDCSSSIVVTHNGIIENFRELKENLSGHHFRSQTDSEVIAHLIEQHYKGDLHHAVMHIIPMLKGTYGLCVLHKNKRELVVARNGSPIVLGIGSGEQFVASDAAALLPHTKQVIYLDDFETGVVAENGMKIFNKNNQLVTKEIKTVAWDVEMGQKHGYKHFMIKEIHEQAQVVRDSLSIAVDIPLLNQTAEPKVKKLFIVACGTAAYAGLIGKYVIEQVARVPVEFDIASEFRYKNPIIEKGDILLAISQSGETADTLAAVSLAKQKGASTIGIVNVMDSTIARIVDYVIYTRAGPEIGVASTKAFMSQLIVLYKIAEQLSGTALGLEQLPLLVEEVLKKDAAIREIAKKYALVYNFIFIGRNLSYPLALEGALKMKEISYIHAEGYAAGEMKHGPIALVTDDVPCVAIAPRDSVYDKMVSNIEEIRARRGKVIAIASEGDHAIQKYCEDVIFIPRINDVLTPFLAIVPLQLLAYHIADLRNCDIDKPRNLAKSVTVE